jgi:hypothetical protein
VLDEQLRAGLADWVRPLAALPAPDLRALRRRARRRGIRRAVTATVITAAVAAVAVGLTATSRVPAVRPPAAGGPRTWAAAPGTWARGTWQPAASLPAPDAGLAAAPYFVTISPRGATAVVTDALTGRVMATVRAPRSGQSFAGVAAAGDDRTFILATGAAGFYELRLGPDGRPESLTLLFTLPARTVPMFAVSPDGRLLAYTTPTGIETVSLALRTGRAWALPGGGSGSGPGSVSDLSWGGDTTLAFEWQVLPAGGVQPAGAGVRLLDVAGSGALLQASRLVIPACASAQVCIGGPQISPGGSTVLATRIALGEGITTTVEAYSARTGQVLGTVSPAVSASKGGQVCRALWADPSGAVVAAFCGHGYVASGGRYAQTDLHVPSGTLNASGETFAW